MEKEFTHLIYYHYINYVMNHKNHRNFIDYFKYFIQQYIKRDVELIDKEEFQNNIKSIENDENISKIQDLIKRIKENHDVEKMKLLLDVNDFKKENIENCLNDLVEDENERDKVNLIDQTNYTIIILYYYYLYKKKKVKFFKSQETKTILEYFTIQNMNRKFLYEKSKLKLVE